MPQKDKAVRKAYNKKQYELKKQKKVIDTIHFVKYLKNLTILNQEFLKNKKRLKSINPVKEYYKNYYQMNKEKIRKQQREYYLRKKLEK